MLRYFMILIYFWGTKTIINNQNKKLQQFIFVYT